MSFLVFLVLVAIVVLTFSLFFRVSEILVEGNIVCGENEIRDASAIENGDFLLFVNKVMAERNIKTKLPYAESVTIKQKLPNTIIISVKETKPLVCFRHRDQYWLVDHKGKLLGYSNNEPGLPLVTGPTLLSPVEGTGAALPTEQEHKLDSLLDVLSALNDADMLNNIQNFDLSDPVDVKFTYMERFVVNLGVSNDLEYKLEYLPRAVEKLEPNAHGIIDLSEVASTKIARFIPVE